MYISVLSRPPSRKKNFQYKAIGLKYLVLPEIMINLYTYKYSLGRNYKFEFTAVLIINNYIFIGWYKNTSGI
jgi:hypothetical protein